MSRVGTPRGDDLAVGEREHGDRATFELAHQHRTPRQLPRMDAGDPRILARVHDPHRHRPRVVTPAALRPREAASARLVAQFVRTRRRHHMVEYRVH
jgi:hypothetical protein